MIKTRKEKIVQLIINQLTDLKYDVVGSNMTDSFGLLHIEHPYKFGTLLTISYLFDAHVNISIIANPYSQYVIQDDNGFSKIQHGGVIYEQKVAFWDMDGFNKIITNILKHLPNDAVD